MNTTHYKYVVLNTEGVCTVALSGEIDYAATLELIPKLDELIENTDCDICFDMENVTFIDSEGIKMLLNSVNQLRLKCRDTRIVRQSKRVEHIFSLIGPQQHLNELNSVPPQEDHRIWKSS